MGKIAFSDFTLYTGFSLTGFFTWYVLLLILGCVEQILMIYHLPGHRTALQTVPDTGIHWDIYRLSYGTANNKHSDPICDAVIFHKYHLNVLSDRRGIFTLLREVLHHINH